MVPPSSYRSAPATTMFSPSLPMSSIRSSSNDAAASTPSAWTARSTRSANAWNSSFFDTGSVSQPMPTIVPTPDSTTVPTRPSVVARSARLPACAMPFSRSSVRAASISPSVSCSARLQSIMPAPVASRSSLTRAALISVTRFSSSQFSDSVSDDARERFRLLDPVGYLGRARDAAHEAPCGVRLGERGDEVLHVALRELRDGVDAGRLEQLGELRADADDANQIRVVDPAEHAC